MDDRKSRIAICGADEIYAHRSAGITHLIRIVNPGRPDRRPDWFKGEYLCLAFGDVVSADDARQYRTRAPDRTDILTALDFSRRAFSEKESLILVSCDYGASRSPALAYVLIADRMGPGRESEALEEVLRIRPDAVPNGMVAALGDDLLGRRGTLTGALNSFFDEITSMIGETPID